MQHKLKAIEKAKQILSESPYDIYHTFEHHVSVWKNILEIAFKENLHPDLDILEVATFWHDVNKGNEKNEEELLHASLEVIGVPLDDINTAVTIIQEHPFGKTQRSDESRLLYDADKIEYVSILRWKSGFDAYTDGLITVEQRDIHIPALNQRIPVLKDSLNFDSSKKMFDEKYLLFKKYMNSINRYKDGKFI